MYDKEQLLKGIRNPGSAWGEIKKQSINQSRNISYSGINKGGLFREINKDSNFGLVLNRARYVFDDWGPATYPFLVKKLIKELDPIIISSQRIYNLHYDKLDYIFSLEPGYSAPKISYKDEHDHTLLVFTSDPNNKTDWFKSYVENNHVDYILCPYYEPFQYYFPTISESKLVHFPWCVPKQFIINDDQISYHGDSEITIYGSSGYEFYKDRDWCRSFSFVNNYHYSRDKKVGSRKEYYDWLRNFDAMIAAHSNEKKWRYIIGKYFEIPAGGALLFAQEFSDLNRVGISEDNAIIFNRENFEHKAKTYLDNPSAYMEKRKKGVELMRSRHTVNDRLLLIKELFGV